MSYSLPKSQCVTLCVTVLRMLIVEDARRSSVYCVIKDTQDY